MEKRMVKERLFGRIANKNMKVSGKIITITELGTGPTLTGKNKKDNSKMEIELNGWMISPETLCLMEDA